MALLDLQAMKPSEERGHGSHGGKPPGSRASKNCGSHADNTSTLSVAICAF